MKNRIGKVLVVGGGISGIRSSLDLAEIGYSVILIDRSPYLGGILSQLDYQFPTDHCGMCKMLPMTDRDTASQYCLRKGFFHENIEIHLSTELASIEGEPGRYSVTLKQQLTGIDQDRCNGCGECVDICPVDVPDLFNMGLNRRKAVYQPVPHNFPHLYQIDPDACNLCGECVTACPTQAIALPDDTLGSREIQDEVGAVILSGGTDYFSPDPEKDTYGYHTFPDVVTSREFERLISGTGPSHGKLARPSDGKPVSTIAWFQCVGSRDLQTDSDFCSSVCCMHAIKEARLVHDKFSDEIETTIFYMDLRTNGKSFQRYRDEAEETHHVRYERARVHTVTWDEAAESLTVKYLKDDGTYLERSFDMIVLSVGQRPAAQTRELAEMLGISLNPWGYCESAPFSSVITSKDGIILSGSYTGLKDISESLIQASSASSSAASLLQHSGHGLAVEKDKNGVNAGNEMASTKVLTAICSTNGSLKEILDLSALECELKQDSAVSGMVVSEAVDYEKTLGQLKAAVETHAPNSLLMVTGLPHLFRKRLNGLAAELNLSPAAIEIVDLNGAAHKDFSGAERNQAVSRLFKTGLSKLKHLNLGSAPNLSVNQTALVIGGGIAGMTAALSIAENGYEVDLVEKSECLGGLAEGIAETLEGHKISQYLQETVDKLNAHPLIRVHKSSEVTDCLGEVGNFSSVITSDGKEAPVSLTHGAVIIATGGKEAQTSAYCYQESDDIVTQLELEARLKQDKNQVDQLSSVVMIQCVDSREEPRNYCSQVCCPTTLKQAIALKEQKPDLAIYVLYRDFMSLGFSESYFTKARKLGIIFISYKPANKPDVSVSDGKLTLEVFEPVLGKAIKLHPDLLVLATGIVPEIPQGLVSGLDSELDQDGFFREAESKWRPVDSLKEGVFSCGICLSPRNITDSIASAKAAAQRSLRILCDKTLNAGRNVAQVRDALCSRCELCIDVCPYHARSFNPETDSVVVNPVMCQGCGSCAVTCPNSASILEGFFDRQLFEMIDSAVSAG